MKMITDLIKERRIYLDGAMGTMLQKRGLGIGQAPEEWNLSHPDEVLDVHRRYLEAGSDIILSNTFGVNSLKYPDYERYIDAAMNIAKEAVSGYENRFTALDIGPLGRLIEPLGDISFEEAVSEFKKIICCGIKYSPDLIYIETMNDSFETKAAVIAAKECSSLPIFVTNAYDMTGRLMTGASVEAMVALLEGLRVDAIGANCSFGPDMMEDIAKKMCSLSSLPVIIKPNAGIPSVGPDGETVYSFCTDEFSDIMEKIAGYGVSMLGGCCGTDEEYISKTISKVRALPYSAPAKKDRCFVSSYSDAKEIGGGFTIVGERINPTGKPRLKEALRNSDLSYICAIASEEEEGADILDVNTGLPEIDEREMMVKTVKAVQAVTSLPLQIDSSDPEVIEAALRIYNGKAMVNSVNGRDESMSKIFPIVRKYGGTVVGLTLDENGIPSSVEGRIEIAKKIIKKAEEYGIDEKDIIIDPLTMAVSAGSENARVTLDTVKALHEMGIKTILGVSNVSFGLPAREKLNAVFCAMAMENGLDIAIINPQSDDMMAAVRSHIALSGKDEAFLEYIGYMNSSPEKTEVKKETDHSLYEAVLKGFKDEAEKAALRSLETSSPEAVIDNEIIKALGEVGEKFENNEIYLPQLLMCAETATRAFSTVSRKIEKKGRDKGEVILCTVEGDIHDIGKNIVKVMLESYGYTVYDLGKDTPPETVLEKVKETGCKVVGLSALMTTTVKNMEKTIKLLRENIPDVFVIVGGAVLNEEYAKMIDADRYCKDAMQSVKIVGQYYGNDN